MASTPTRMTPAEQLLVEALGAINMALDPASVRRRGSRAELELLAAARRRTVTALDAVLADERVWRTAANRAAADRPAGHPAELVGDRITDLLVQSGHRPPPPAGDLIADIRRAVTKVEVAPSRKARRRAMDRTRRALVALRDALSAVPPERPARRMLRRTAGAVLALLGIVGTGIAQNAAYDVAKHQLMELTAQRAEQAVTPGRPNDLQRAIQESIHREQLYKERRAKAEAEAAELRVLADDDTG